MAQAKQKKRFDFNAYIANQAINYDKASWNCKDLHFALFVPLISWVVALFIVMLAIFRPENIENQTVLSHCIIWVVIGAPTIYFALRHYMWPLFLIPILMFIADIYDGKISLIQLCLESFFVLPIMVEQYRRKQGLDKPKNIKFDIFVGILLLGIYPLIYGVSQLL